MEITSPRSEPLIGIVIPAYNCGRYIAFTLQSIVNQTLTDWQCTVVNDGSKDDTLQVARDFAAQESRIVVTTQENAGMSAARNQGLRMLASSVRYVVFMDADDLWRPDTLEKLRTALEAHPEAIGAHGLADFIDPDGDPVDPGGFAAFGRERFDCTGGRIVHCPVDEPTTFSMVATICKIVPPGLLLFRRAALDRIGGMDEQLQHVQDFDFFIRLCRLGNLVFLDEVVLYYRRHPANTGSLPENTQWLRRVRHKAFFSPENSAQQQRQLRQSWKALQRSIAQTRLRETGQLFREKQVSRALLHLLRLPLIAYRFVRGYPTLRGL